MPKAGVEPARGTAPLDFESSASSSSATSARRSMLADSLARADLKGARSDAIIAFHMGGGATPARAGHRRSYTPSRALAIRRRETCRRPRRSQ